MNTLIHADIFFFVSTIAIIVFTFCGIVILAYAIVIIRDFSHISRKIKEEGLEIVDDVKMLRKDMKRDGLRIGQIIHFFRHFTKKRRASKQEEE